MEPPRPFPRPPLLGELLFDYARYLREYHMGPGCSTRGTGNPVTLPRPLPPRFEGDTIPAPTSFLERTYRRLWPQEADQWDAVIECLYPTPIVAKVTKCKRCGRSGDHQCFSWDKVPKCKKCGQDSPKYDLCLQCRPATPVPPRSATKVGHEVHPIYLVCMCGCGRTQRQLEDLGIHVSQYRPPPPERVPPRTYAE